MWAWPHALTSTLDQVSGLVCASTVGGCARLLAALAVVVTVLAVWAWQPSRPRALSATADTSGLRIGETVALPEFGSDASVTLDRVENVLWCSGRWWSGIGTIFSGPITKLTVTSRGVPDPVGVISQEA